MGRGELGSNSGALGDWVRDSSGLFPDSTALRRLGALYLAVHPAERSQGLLAQLLIGGDEGTVPSRLFGAVARDWSVHNVVAVDGWVLARTEARLCAFLYLEKGARA
jgi:hypothetical protein